MAKTFISPARRILGAAHVVFSGPCARVGLRLVELETPEEELARDRRALGKIGAGAAGLGLAGAYILNKGRGTVVKVQVPVATVKTPKGRPAKAGAPSPTAAAKGKRKATSLEEKRDKLSKVRDVAVIGGTAAAGAGAIAAGAAARKASKRIGDAAGYASSSISRAAKEVKREVTPERVAREGLKVVKKKVKEKAVEYFPTFTKAAKVLKKRVFSTPAQRLGIFEFKTRDREQLRNVNTDVFANPLRVAAGDEKAYRPGPGKTKIVQDLPVAHAQVIRSAVREGKKIAKWGGRGSALAKDVKDVVTGNPRARDASGRKKKREWEKSWAQNAAKTAVATGAVLAHVTAKRKSPGYRAGVNKVVRGAKKKVNEYVPDAFPERGFQTPAQRLGVIELAKKNDEARKDAAVGAVAGAAQGATVGAVAPLLGKEGTQWGKLNARVRAAENAVADEMAHGGSWKKKKTKGPFGKRSKFGKGERLARAEHEALGKLKRGMKKGAAKGALAGAAVLGSAGYAVGRLRGEKLKAEKRRRGFETPARRLGVIAFDAVAESAGWDVRDPRGRSARVFAPGSRKRERRPKRWHEEVENERKLWKAGVATAAVGGGAAGLVLGKGVKNGPAGAAVAKLKRLKK